MHTKVTLILFQISKFLVKSKKEVTNAAFMIFMFFIKPTFVTWSTFVSTIFCGNETSTTKRATFWVISRFFLMLDGHCLILLEDNGIIFLTYQVNNQHKQYFPLHEHEYPFHLKTNKNRIKNHQTIPVYRCRLFFKKSSKVTDFP